MDLFSKIDKAYPIPSQVAIMNGYDPSDYRAVCDSVSDFQDVLDNHGFEIRYEGLITYEKSTSTFKGCKKVNNQWTWVSLEGGSGSSGSNSNVSLLDINIEASKFTTTAEGYSYTFDNPYKSKALTFTLYDSEGDMVYPIVRVSVDTITIYNDKAEDLYIVMVGQI